MIYLACVGLLMLAHVITITYLICKMTGTNNQSQSPFKTVIAAFLAVLHVLTETAWAAALGFAIVLGAAMATQPLGSQSTLAIQYMAYIAIPLFVLTFPVLQILGKTTKSFRIEGWSAVAISATLIAADLAFNAGAAIAIGHVKV